MKEMSIIGIDLGSSATKMINMNGKGQILNKLILNKTQAQEAKKIFMNNQKIDKNNIQKINEWKKLLKKKTI